MKINNNFIKNRMYAYSIVLLSISILLGYIEVIIPMNAGYFGVKIGLSNIISIIGLKVVGVRNTFIINILRIIVFGVLFGNIARFLISIFAFLASFIVLVIYLNYLRCRILISSMFAAILHNIAQLICVSFIVKNLSIMSLLPLYIVFGIISGIIVGLISKLCLKYIDKLHLNN